ncbi:MAG: hypothetical protein ACUVWS_19360 [Roseiflexus sp.]
MAWLRLLTAKQPRLEETIQRLRAGDDRIAVDEDVIRACGQVVFGNEGSLPFVVF